jgi:hypothetical protein
MFSKAFLPEAFYSPFSLLHRQINAAIDSEHKKIAIAAPRGLGKTTTVRSAVIREICYRKSDFIVYISNSATNAELQTENIKRELLTNPDIRGEFGNITVDKDIEGLDEQFSKSAWVAFANTLVLPRGAGQQVRGLIYKNTRPQYIIIDDLEKKEELDNPENREKLKSWFYSDLLKCVNRYNDDWRFIYIDTLKHYDSLLQELLDSPDWNSLRLDLCDDECNSFVPDLISTEELLKEREIHRRKGQLDVFYMEYRNLPVAKETQEFKEEYFKYYNETDEGFQPSQLENVVIYDPAKTANPTSADSAIVVLGVNYRTHAIYFRDCVNGKLYPDQQYDHLFTMIERYNAYAVGIEVTGLEEFIKQPILNEMHKRGKHFEPIWLKARGGPAEGEKGKIKRIASLIPYYRQGYIFHNRAICGALEKQLVAFPKSSLLDVADATAYVVEMLELGERYFVAPEGEDPEDEFAELEYDDPIEDWRTV